jgi:Transglutaminase-like superfamily
MWTIWWPPCSNMVCCNVMNSRKWPRRLAPTDLLLVVEAVVLLPIVTVALRHAGLRRVQAALAGAIRPRGPGGRPVTAVRSRVRRIGRVVRRVAASSPWSDTCLVEALTAWFLMRRDGIDSHLRFGVRKRGEELEAHAWIEFAGEAVTGNVAAGEFVTFGSPGDRLEPVETRGLP